MSTARALCLAGLAGLLAGALGARLAVPTADLAREERAREEVAERVERLAARLDATDRELAATRAALEQWKRRVEDQISSSVLADPPAAPAGDSLASAFERLGEGGVLAVHGPLGHEVVERLRTLGAAGSEFLRAALHSEEEEARFVAAALAGRIADPALVAPLAAAARGDGSALVRRAAAHALARVGGASAGDALVSLVDDDAVDGEVRLSAWRGLATLGRPEAIDRLSRVLDSGEGRADLAVDAALETGDARLHPALRRAYDHEAVSDRLRIAILRTLARESGGWDEFIRSVAGDAKASLELRETAQALLAGSAAPAGTP